MTALAFYKGKGNWLDWAIRLVTRSTYSHVELLTNQCADDHFICWSSSARDGGVRIKSISLNLEHWDIVSIDWYPGEIVEIFEQHFGASYDYMGIVFSQFFNFRRQDNKRWFCSEICATALGLPSPESYSPGSLKLAVEKLNQVHSQGKCESARASFL